MVVSLVISIHKGIQWLWVAWISGGEGGLSKEKRTGITTLLLVTWRK